MTTVRECANYFPRNSVLSRSRALCTCDFDVPSAMPSTSATSVCSRPSTSCSTNAARQPSGSYASARSRSIRLIARSPRRWLSPSGQHRRVVEAVGQLAGPRRPAADVVQDLVHRQPIQPGARAPTRRGSSPSFRCADEKNLLQQILGVGGVAEHPYRQAEKPARVGAVQLLERAQLSPAAALDEREVGVASGGARLRGSWKVSLALRRRHRGSRCRLGPVSRRASSLITVKTNRVRIQRLFRRGAQRRSRKLRIRRFPICRPSARRSARFRPSLPP